MNITDSKRVTTVSSNMSRGCEHCNFGISHDDLAGAINHFLSSHGYSLLHVGTESMPGESPVFNTTVAILGCDNPPPILDRSFTVEFVAKDNA